MEKGQLVNIIGIDPGISGAIAILDGNGLLVEVYDMPTMANGKKQQVNGAELAGLLWRYEPTQTDGRARCIVEDVHAMPGQGVASMFSFGMGLGVILGVLAALQIPVTRVTPGTWKRRAGLLGKEKDMARTVAQQLYPAAPLGRKKDIGRADALLIARYGIEGV